MVNPDSQILIDDLHHPDRERREQAIIAVARQSLQDALPALDQITRLDPDPALRDLARRAIRHIHKKLNLHDPLGFDDAHRQLIRALQIYKKNGAVAAAPALAVALRLDPTLQEDELAQRIAASATGLPPKEATQALIYADQYGQLIRSDRGGWQPRRRRRPYQWVIVALLAGLTLILFLQTGAFRSYINSLQTGQWREHLQRSGETDYYLFVPTTSPPPQGWGVLVVLHDFSYGADSLLSSFVRQAETAGVILIAPNFGEYPFPFSEAATPEIDAILQQVRKTYPVDQTGAVIFGYRTGGEIATLYAQDYYQVAGVVTVGATDLALPPADDETIQYLLMFGELDPSQGYVYEKVAEFQSLANPVEVLYATGTGTELTADLIERTMQFVRRIYAP